MVSLSYFGNDGSQILKFQPIKKAIKTFSGVPNTISEWESKWLPQEKINPPFTANQILSPQRVWMNNSRIRLQFKGSWLKHYKVTITPNNVVNLFIVYELDTWSRDLNTDFTLKDCLGL